MKIVTWNINGLRAGLRKSALDPVWKLKPDVVCLQEIKVRPDQLKEEDQHPNGYDSIWHPAERPGYSGVATFLRKPANGFKLGLGEPRFDAEGRVISTHHDSFRLFNAYFPSGTRGRERVDFKLDFYARMLKVCNTFQRRGEALIICGDFNTAHMPIDLKNARQNQSTSGFLPEEREWVQKFIDHGFVDIYRRMYPERVQYTWWTNILNARQRGVGWRLDYFLVSEALVPRVRDVIIHESIQGSDHCPVELILS